ncbi:DEAD/DEAH box helicase family protein [Corynebacterium accolens]|uniref:DEAD/DEAH box helicase n=1 Tax=Corynebacterium accolens TaxID=38284 RepID=UPI0026709A7E|nr:DEAD/DEAH box helicase family protein [Corynebacterium accolens]WKS68170.1 DEAD/DEAH box helicase family protein [Corynebacterium accolens]WKS70535.1 DEAD/DEAH box helicase family protein [Corynebacterium accolens]WKS72734.1 DEAD/DEAH box helicase family protein [Corynebacterium accolens]
MTLHLSYDPALVDELSASFGLRAANTRALDTLARRMDSGVDGAHALVMDMATGAGKTYVMAAFIEYLRRGGVRNVVVVTPGLVVQTKTVANFTRGSGKFIEGAALDPVVITPDNYKSMAAGRTEAEQQSASSVFVFNIQQLIAPKKMEGETKSGGKQATARGIRKFSEYAGVLYDDLASRDDLVVIADEHHLYSASAASFHAAIADLNPAMLVGLTASADDNDDVVFRYTLREAIGDKSVKTPVIVYRRDGYGEREQYQQLKDAATLREFKQRFYDDYAARHADDGTSPINPVMMVVCENIAHATEVEELLAGPEFFNDPYAVLRVDSDSMTEEKTALLNGLDNPDSPVRAVVSVNKLKEGWDTRSIAVMVTLRAMDSDILTQQTLGRGLRLPFKRYTDVEAIDTLEIVAHDSFRRLLRSEKVLHSFGVDTRPQELDTDTDTKTDTDTETGTEPPQPDIGTVSVPPQPDTDTGTRPGTGPALTVAGDPGTVTTGQPDTTTQGDTELAGQNTSNKPVGQLRELGGQGRDLDNWHDEATTPAVVELVECFRDVSFWFPHTTCMREDEFFPLHKLTNADIVAAAGKVTDEATSEMERYKLKFKAHTITTHRLEQMQVQSVAIDTDTARREIKTIILANKLIDRNSENLSQLDNRIVPAFMNSVSVSEWTVDALATAHESLRMMVSQAVKQFTASLEPTVRLVPLLLPHEQRRSYQLPKGRDIIPRPEDKTKFVRRQYYSGWKKGLYNAAAFDSYSGEAKLASDLDVSPDVEWWTRLYPEDRASIGYAARRSYYPDFIVRDKEGRTWIVEGKDAGGRDNDEVQKKRAAAEEAINLMASHPDMSGVKIGYVIAYEDTISTANSWRRLLSVSDPIVSPN